MHRFLASHFKHQWKSLSASFSLESLLFTKPVSCVLFFCFFRSEGRFFFLHMIPPQKEQKSTQSKKEQQAQNSLDREIPSTVIGKLAMDKLKNIDEVAYVRFASVYRQFKDINTFMEELSRMIEKKSE